MTDLERAIELRAPALAICRRYGTWNSQTRAVESRFALLRLTYRAPRTGVLHGLHIWSADHRVMSLIWDPPDLIEFIDGNWVGQVQQYGHEANTLPQTENEYPRRPS